MRACACSRSRAGPSLAYRGGAKAAARSAWPSRMLAATPRGTAAAIYGAAELVYELLSWFQLTTRASAGDGGVCFRWDADACARSRRRRGARACVKLCGRAATDACTSVPWARTQRPCAPPLTLVCAHAMMRHGAARLAAWSWLQALVDGGHSRETKALLVHGGLAAFFYLFYRKCALAPHMFCPAHTHCQPCAHVPCQECRERGAPRSGAALRSLASLAARACCCCPLDASESAAPGSGPCASGSTGATT